MKPATCCSRLALLLVPLAVFGGPAVAQTYPTKPIRVIVPFAPGGATDIVARMLAPRLSENLGQSVVVENRGGGGTTIGMQLVVKAPPDGYTLGVATLTFALNPSLVAKLPYSTEKDFMPVSLISQTPFVMSLHPSVPAKSVKELIALAKARPGALNFSSSGIGSASQMAVELFKYMTGTDMVHVPYTGGGPALVSVLSGEVSIFTTSIPAGLPHFKAGKLKPLGVTSAKRDPILPNTPSIAEAGLAGYELLEYQGFVVPAGTPRSVIDRLHRGVVESLAAPDLRERFTTTGAHVVGSNPEEFATYIRTQISRWAKVIQATGIRID